MEEKKKDIKPIDFTKIVKKLWPHRKKYYYVLPATLIFTYLFMVCIPRYYECTVSLAPEANGASVSGSISSLASSFGLGGSLAKLNSQDAIYAEIYPEVISSKNFIAELMTIEIKTTDSITCSYYTYLRDKQKSPWWGQVENAITGLFMHPKKDSYDGEKKISVFTLNKQQSEVFASAKGKIRCRYDKKTDIVSIRVQDQDPLVCAIIADSTCQRLQDFIVAYRTNKARIDYEYFQKLCEKSKKDYETALYNYAAIADANRNTVLESYHAKVEKLENEMQTKYNIYNTMSTQLQAAAAKLQESTPAFTIIESASIPFKPAGPKRMIISIFMMIVSFFALSGWILIKE